MTFVLDHALAILFALLFALGVVLLAAVIREYLSTRAPGARTIERKEERRDSYGDQRRSPEGRAAR